MNTSHRWVRVTAVENVPLREGRAVSIGGRELAVFNLGDRVRVTANRCPHRGGPLCDGIVTGAAVVCPLHAWKVDLESGGVQRPATAGACVETYPARVEDGIVLVRLPIEPATSVISDNYVGDEVVSDEDVGAGYLVHDAAPVYGRSHDERQG
jgi:nitrite reductase (NADH) small subunit